MTVAVGGRPALEQRLFARGRGLATRAGVTAALVAGTAWVGVGDPNHGGFFPRCIYYQATGHWCPGCGGLRAVHDLLHGDVSAALGMNAAVVLVILPLGLTGLVWWWLDVLGVKVPTFRVPTWVAWILPAVLLVFGVLRNIPALVPYLAP